MNKENAIYIFTGSSPQNLNIISNPYFTHWIELIGNKKLYNREDIEKFSAVLAKSLSQRLLNLGEGAELQLRKISR